MLTSASPCRHTRPINKSRCTLLTRQTPGTPSKPKEINLYNAKQTSRRGARRRFNPTLAPPHYPIPPAPLNTHIGDAPFLVPHQTNTGPSAEQKNGEQFLYCAQASRKIEHHNNRGKQSRLWTTSWGIYMYTIKPPAIGF